MSTGSHRSLVSEVVEGAAFRCVSALRSAEDWVGDGAGVHDGAAGVEGGESLAWVRVRWEPRVAGTAFE